MNFQLLYDLDAIEWMLVIIAAAGIGISKSGFIGVGMVHVIILAGVFGPRVSTGILLPMLIVGDVCSVVFFGQHTQWKFLKRLMLPAIVGIILAWQCMNYIDDRGFRLSLGCIILGLTLTQIARIWKPKWFEYFPHATWFAWSLGLLAGFTTMLANAAGPIVALYLLAVSLPKMQLVGTGAWFFLLINLVKVPFSYNLGLITISSLSLNLILAPVIVGGLLVGKSVVKRIPQKLFDSLLLTFTGIMALRLIGLF